MIKLVGLRRAIVLGFVGGVNLLLLLTYLLWVMPQRDDSLMRLRTIEGEIGDLSGRIGNIKQELADFKTNLPRYNEFKSRGFFSAQNRFDIARELDKIRIASGVTGFSYKIDDIKTISIPELEATGYRMINSRINVTNIAAISDKPLYVFIGMMQRDFPMSLRLSSFTTQKQMDVTEDVLKTMSGGTAVATIRAEAVFDWYTLQPLPQVDPVTGAPIQ